MIDVTPRVVARVLERLEGVRRTPNGWSARCPAHEDRRASLAVSIGENGGCVLHCFGGCSPQEVVSAMGLCMKDLAPEENGHAAERPAIVATYDYRDETGELLFQVVRFAPKDFRQRRPKLGGGWDWSVKGVRVVPYRLPELLADPDAIAFVVEGEKDIDALAAAGVLATCNAGGAGKWRSEHAEFLRGRRVVVLPDNDDPGRKHGRQVAESLRGVATSVRVVDLPGLPQKGDVSDWLAAGGTRERLLQLAEAAGEWTPTEDRPAVVRSSPTPAPEFHHTDLGNARRLVHLHGKDLRFCHPWGKWLVWDGRRWKLDDSGEVDRRARDTVREMWREVAETDDDIQRKALAGWARSCESTGRLRGMVELARAEEGVPVLPEELDRDSWALNCMSGTIDLRTGDVREHRREDMLTKLAPVEYGADCPIPLWESFLGRIFGGNADLIGFVRRLAGYCLTGDVREQIFPIFHGKGSNGKSVLLGVLQGVMGDGYAMSAAADMLMARQGEAHPTELTDLFGRRLAVAIETEDNRRLAETLIKELTGGDRIRARRMREDFWEFAPTHKVILASNHRPRIRGTDHAIWRRVRLVPFSVTIPADEQDRELPARLQGEYPGILAWAVGGCLEWQRDGLRCPQEVMAATEQYRDQENEVAQFLADCCTEGPDERIKAGDLYGAYKRWCDGQDYRAMSQRRFGEQAGERFPKAILRGTPWYVGVDMSTSREGDDIPR